MKKIIFIISFIIVLIIINEIIQGVLRQIKRRKIYEMAKECANKTKKPLLVYGDPFNGFGSRFYNNFIRGYECGDETIDLTGCPKCKTGVKDDILLHLKKKGDNSSIIFISCVLEYVDDIEDVIKEIYRVAGSVNNIFIVTVGKFSLSSFLYRESDYSTKNIISAPPEYKKIIYKKIK